MSFLAELLEWFEVKKPDFVKPIQPIDLTGWYPHQAAFMVSLVALCMFLTPHVCL